MIEVLQVETEFAQLRALYEKTAPAGVLEIGTYQGGTLKEWLTLGDPLRVVAVDIDHVNPDLYEGWRQPHTFLQVVTGDSRSPHVRAQIEEFAPYDWAFIDGDHAAEAVVNDAGFVLPLMRERGYLAFHDLVGGDDCPDYAPGRVVDGLETQGYEVQRFVEPGGARHRCRADPRLTPRGGRVNKIEFSYRPATRVLAEADPSLPGGILGQWPDGFVALIPGGPEILDDPGSRPALIERFEQIRVVTENCSSGA